MVCRNQVAHIDPEWTCACLGLVEKSLSKKILLVDTLIVGNRICTVPGEIPVIFTTFDSYSLLTYSIRNRVNTIWIDVSPTG